MKLENAYKNAFPCDGEYAYESRQNKDCGLTKREYFAAKAMEGLILNLGIADTKLAIKQRDLWIESYGNITEAECVAKDAVLIADALLKELNK